MKRIATHLSQNLVAYIALFVALGGTSYAAVTLQNHSINPIKLNRKYIGGYIRAWASVDANGHVAAGSGGVRVTVSNAGAGGYEVVWRGQRFVGCGAQASARAVPGPADAGFTLADLIPAGARIGRVDVSTENAQGQPSALPFLVSVVCPTP
jgi:hypothetical protein